MNSRNWDETPVPQHYGRTQFLTDVAWMGLKPEQAFSARILRRQRDLLMNVHHPDRGGSEEMAARINVTYSRMLGWLEKRLPNRNHLRLRRDKAMAREAEKNLNEPSNPVKQKLETMRFYAAILGTAAAVLGIGITSLTRRQR